MIVDYYDRLNNEDVSFGMYLHEESNTFPRTGGLLDSAPFSAADTQAEFDAGLDFDVELRHLEAHVFGDTGLATYYTEGTTT